MRCDKPSRPYPYSVDMGAHGVHRICAPSPSVAVFDLLHGKRNIDLPLGSLVTATQIDSEEKTLWRWCGGIYGTLIYLLDRWTPDD